MNVKKVIKRLNDSNLSFSDDESLMSLALSVKDWLDETQSEPKTIERILTHETLNDYEKAAGLFLLGTVISSRAIALMQGKERINNLMEEMLNKLKGIE